MTLNIGDFQQDAPYASQSAGPRPQDGGILPTIYGVELTVLRSNQDARGELTELMTFSEVRGEPVEHVYRVQAAPGSVRAWVFHKLQADRLAFTQGEFRIVLYDLRPESPSFGKLDVLDLGAGRPVRLRIPPLVVHGVQNCGASPASFVNMPTRAWHPGSPDKWRIPQDHPGVPYRF